MLADQNYTGAWQVGATVTSSWRSDAGVGEQEMLMREGGEAPSAGIQSERVEAWGAAGRTTWTPVVG